MQQISAVSQLIRGAVMLVALLHLTTIAFALTLNQPDYIVSKGDQSAQFHLQQRVTLTGSWVNFAQELQAEGLNSLVILSLPESFFYAFIYVSLFRLFGRYKRGQVFDEKSIKIIRNIGICIFIWPVFTILYPSLVALGLRATGLSDSLALSFGIGSSELVKVLGGLVVFVVGWIMSEARELQQEQELTI